MDDNAGLWKLALTAITGLIGVIVAILTFMFKKHKDSHDTLKDSHQRLELDVAKNYATIQSTTIMRDEFSRAIARVHDRLEERTDTIINLLQHKNGK